MAYNFWKVRKGLTIKQEASSSASEAGDIDVSGGKLNFHNGTSSSAMVTEGHAAALTNKTIDSDVNTLSNIVDACIKAGAAIAYSKLALSNSIVNADINSAAAIAYSKLALTGSIVNADVASAAAIAYSKLAPLTANKALVSDASGVVSASSVTSTELGYVSGVTSSIQTQLNSKQAGGNYVTALTGDVSATGPGSVAATVNTVGGSSAANVHSAELAANAATNLNTTGTIVKRDGSGNFSAGTISANVTGNLTGNVTGNVSGNVTGNVTGNVSGTSANVTGTVAIANGGTGQTTQQAAIDALAGTQASGKYLRSDGTHTTLSNIQAADVPTLNQNTTGTAANVTATSNATLTTLSSLSLLGSQVSGNISGNAANVTGTVAIANGGTGATTANAGLNALLPTQTGNAAKYLTTDGSNTSWANVAGGGSGSGVGDDLNNLKYQVSVFEDFTQSPAQSHIIDTAAGKTDSTLYDGNSTYFRLAYDASKTVTGTGTSMTLSGAPGFTVKAGDVLVVSGEARRITAIASQTSYTIESAFTSNPTAAVACVSQAVHTVDLNNFAGDGLAPSAAISSTFNEVLVDYADTTTSGDTIQDIGITPHVAYSASVDGSLWCSNKSRTTAVTDVNQAATFSTAGSNLYIRFFANKSSGSGFVNLLDFKAYWQAAQAQQYGAYASQAFALLNGAGTPVNCTLSTVNGKTRVALGWSFTNGVNVGSPNGQIEVTINGQKIPRFINSTLTPDASYTEVNGNTIDLDTDYSALAYEIEVLKRVGVVDTSSDNASRILKLEQQGVSKGTGKNYITYGNFENGNATGWSLSHTALSGTTPTSTSFTSAAVALSISTVTSGQLAGTYSLQMASSAATTAGDMLLSDVYTIDIADQAKVLSYKFNYKLAAGTANFSGTSSNTYAVYIYDVTNSAWIQPAGVYNLVQSSGVGVAQGTFQTPSNMTQFRLALVNINATSSAVTLLLDDIYVGPQSLAFGPPVTDTKNDLVWTYDNIGTTAANVVSYRQVGDRMYVQGFVTAGTTAAATFAINLPSGKTLDTAKLGASNLSVGKIERLATGVNYAGVNLGPFPITYDGSTANKLFVSQGATNATTFAKANASNVLNTGDSFSFSFDVPISGWSSNTVMSADSDTRQVVFVGQKVNGQSVTANVTNYTFTSIKDSHGTFNGSDAWTAPVSGDYDVLLSTVPTASCYPGVYVNGTRVTYIGNYVAPAGRQQGVAALPGLKAWDIISVRSDTTTTIGSGTGDYIEIRKQSGPATVAASESVNAKYRLAGSVSVSPTQPINYATKDFDSHNAVTTGSGWKFTAPSSGKYRVSTNLATAATVSVEVFKNGVADCYIGTATSTAYGGGSTLVSLLAGEYIDIRADGTTTTAGTSSLLTVSIERVGN